MKGCCIAIATASLAGCATAPIPGDQAIDVPASRVRTAKWAGNGVGTGRVIVKRDKGFSGSACFIRLFVDGESVADMDTAERLVMHLPTGEHVLSASTVGSMCGAVVVETMLNADSSRTKMLRVGFAGSMDLFIQPTAF